MADGHLSASALQAWRDRGDGDRERIVGHLATCAACRHAAAELERERPLAADVRPTRFDVHEFATAGRRFSIAPPATRGLPRRTAYLAAAAAVVLAAIVVPRWWPASTAPSLRGSGTLVDLSAPVGTAVTVDALAFEWTAAPAAGTLRLVVMSLDDVAPLVDREVSGTRYVLSAEEQRRFRAGRDYHWFVEYRGAGAGTSPSARFRVR